MIRAKDVDEDGLLLSEGEVLGAKDEAVELVSKTRGKSLGQDRKELLCNLCDNQLLLGGSMLGNYREGGHSCHEELQGGSFHFHGNCHSNCSDNC